MFVKLQDADHHGESEEHEMGFMNKVSRQINCAGRNREQESRRQRTDSSEVSTQAENQPNSGQAKNRRNKSDGSGCQPVFVLGFHTKNETQHAWEQCSKVVKRWSMVILRVVTIPSLPNQAIQKVSIDAFVVMQRHQIQIIKTQKSRDRENGNHRN